MFNSRYTIYIFYFQPNVNRWFCFFVFSVLYDEWRAVKLKKCHPTDGSEPFKIDKTSTIEVLLTSASPKVVLVLRR